MWFRLGLNPNPVQPILILFSLNQLQQRVGFAAIADHNPQPPFAGVVEHGLEFRSVLRQFVWVVK